MNIVLDVTQCCICPCFRKIFEKSYTIADLTQTINLVNGYTLSILSYTNTSISILIQNDNNMYIRNLFTSYPFEICINDNCCNCNYYLSIVTTINQT